MGSAAAASTSEEIYDAADPAPVSSYSCSHQDVPTHNGVPATRRLYYDANRSNNPV